MLNGQRLVIPEDEAALVRTIFKRFVSLQSVSLPAQELTEQGVTTKNWITRSGKVRGGKPIDKTYIDKLLNNRMLIGELQVGNAWQPAAHEPIVDKALWEQAQASLSSRRRPRKRPVLTDGGMDFLLRGRVFGEDGRAYSPWTSSVRGNRIYRYCGNPARVLDQLPDWMTQHPEYSEAHLSQALTRIAEVWPALFPFFKNQIVLRVLDRVTAFKPRAKQSQTGR